MAEHENKGSSQRTGSGSQGGSHNQGGGHNQGGSHSQGGEGTVHSAVEKAGDFASQARDKASELGSQAREKVGDFANQAREFAGQAADKAQEWAHGAASRFNDMRDSVTDWSQNAYEHPGDVMRSANQQMTSLIRTYPIPAILVGFGVGFLLAHMLNDRR